MSRQFRLLQFTRSEISTARAVPRPHDRRVILWNRGRPYVAMRPRPPPWPENIIGPPRPGDHRTPVERWQDFHFSWEAHFYG
jgi:hypothetical protein